MEAADEIGLAVIATTFTLVAVFLPTAFMSGVAGQVLQAVRLDRGDRGVRLAASSRGMLTPMMAAYMLNRPDSRAHREGRVDRASTCAGPLVPAAPVRDDGRRGTVFFFGSLALVPLLPTGFIPPGRPVADAGAPSSCRRARRSTTTVATAEQARARSSHKNGHVKRIYTDGRRRRDRRRPVRAGGAAEVRKAHADAQPDAARRRGRQQAGDRERAARRARRGARRAHHRSAAAARARSTCSSSPARTAHVLAERARAVEHELRTLPASATSTSTASLVRPEIIVRPDSARAADLGVTTHGDRRHAAHRHRRRLRPEPRQAQPRAAPGADRRQAAARARATDLQLLARLRGARRARAGAARQRRDARDRQRPGADRPLRPPAQHQLRDRAQRAAARRGGAAGAQRCRAVQTCRPASSGSTVGDAEAMAELFASFGLAMLTGVLCIYIVLVLLFKDFVQPVTILVAPAAVDRRARSSRCCITRTRCRCRR